MYTELDDLRALVEGIRLGEAEAGLTSYVARHPSSSEGWALLGITRAKARQWEPARIALEGAVGLEPERSETLIWLAVVFRQLFRSEDAVPLLQRALAAKPDDHETLNLLGSCYLQLGQADLAEAAFRKSLDEEPRSASAMQNLGLSLRMQNRGDEALSAFRSAVELDPGQPQNHLQLAKQLQQLSQWEASLQVIEKALRTFPQSHLLKEALALTFGRLNRKEEAEETFKSLATRFPSSANAYAVWLQEEGRFEDSVPVLTDSLKLRPKQGAPYRNLVEAKQSQIDGKPILEKVSELSNDAEVGISDRMHLAYAGAKLYDRKGEYEEAMRWFDRANTLAYQVYPACRTFNPYLTASEPATAAASYTKGFIEELAAHGASSNRPIFIVGMIRSGTTLLDQIVSSHPQVESTGEGMFWSAEGDGRFGRADIGPLASRYLETIAPQGRFTDKMPLNYRRLGLIHAAFPNAKILHIRRSAFDTCLSIYTTFFAGGPNFAYNKENISCFYRAYERYMEHWRQVLPRDSLMELDYEGLVAEPEAVVRQVIEFLGLAWSDACLAHQHNSAAVTTPSRWQARQPIYVSSVGKKTRYGRYIPEFADLE